jgi:hypothetical protein
MNKKFKYLLPLVLLLILAFPSTAFAKNLGDDQVVAGGSFTLNRGESLDGSLIVFGGIARTETDSRVEGDVVVLGGAVTVDGVVEGNVAGIGGVVNLDENAVVEGDLISLGAALNREPGATVYGQVISGFDIPALTLIPEAIDIPSWTSFEPTLFAGSFSIWRIFWFIFRTLLWGAVAALVALILPNPTTRVSKTVADQTIISGGVGLLTIIVAPIILLLLAITCILSPLSLLGALALAVAWYFGRIAIGLELGERLAKVFNQEWPLPLSAGIGTFGLALVVDGLDLVLPCIGWLIVVLVGLFGLGAVLLTRYGSRPYPSEPATVIDSEGQYIPDPSAVSETPAIDEGAEGDSDSLSESTETPEDS